MLGIDSHWMLLIPWRNEMHLPLASKCIPRATRLLLQQEEAGLLPMKHHVMLVRAARREGACGWLAGCWLPILVSHRRVVAIIGVRRRVFDGVQVEAQLTPRLLRR